MLRFTFYFFSKTTMRRKPILLLIILTGISLPLASPLSIDSLENYGISSYVLSPLPPENLQPPVTMLASQDAPTSIWMFTDLAIYKGYTMEQIRQELNIREELAQALKLYYGQELTRWDAEDEAIIASWANIVKGGLVDGIVPLEQAKQALERAGEGAELSDADKVVFAIKYATRGNFGDHFLELHQVQNQYGFTMADVLANKIKVLYSFGSWQRDPLLFKEEGINYSFDSENTYAGSMYSLKLEYDVNTPDAHAINGFYINLDNQDLSKQDKFVFFVKGGPRQGPPPAIPLPLVRQDPNAGYSEQFKLEFEDNKAKKASYMVRNIKQDEWSPVVIEKDRITNAGGIDWENITKINLVFADGDALPDKDGVIYIDGLLKNPKEQIATYLASNVKQFLKKFYNESENERTLDLRRLGVEGISYLEEMDDSYIDDLYLQLRENPLNIFNIGADLLYQNVMPNATTSLVDLLGDLLLPQILQGKVTPENIKDGIDIPMQELVRVAGNKMTPLFPYSNVSLDEIPSVAEWEDILARSIRGENQAAVIVKKAELNGVKLYLANFFADETAKTGIVPSLEVNRVVIPYTNAENTLPGKTPFIAIIKQGGNSEYVVVTDAYKQPIQGRFSPLYVKYLDNAAVSHRETWDDFREKWRAAGGLGLVVAPVLVGVNKDYKYVLIKRITGSNDNDKIIYVTPDGERTSTFGEFANIFTGQVLNPVRPYRQFVTVDYQKLKDKASEMAKEKAPLNSPPPVPELDPPPDGDVTAPGLNYTEYEAIRGDVVYRDRESWIEARPRGNVHKDPINLYVYNSVKDEYGLIDYILTQYDYIDPLITPPLEEIPVDGQYISGVKIGHKMSDGKFPEIINISGNGYVRFTGFPPLLMGASLRFGFHNVGGSSLAENPAEEDFPKITDVYIKKLDEEKYRIMFLLNAQDYTAALDITLTPGEETTMEVKATYYPKRDIDLSVEPNTGFVGFSSMFWKGAKDTPQDPYDQAHDSDFVTVFFNDGSNIEYPLSNPASPNIIDFKKPDKGISGFMLEQKERDPQYYKAYPGDEFHNRASYQLEMLNSTIPLTVKLYTFPTNERFMDNVVVFMSPIAEMLKANVPITLQYIIKAKK